MADKTRYLILAFIIFFIYLFTMHPAVSPYRDSGDLISAGYTLGTAHPTGYPLYILSAKIFNNIAIFGNTAYRVNFMSVFYAVLALLALFAAINLVFPDSKFLNTASVLFISFTPAYWRLAQVSEMYSLNAFLCALVIYYTLKFVKSRQNENGPEKRYIFMSFFLLGLGLTNHQTILFLTPALLIIFYKPLTKDLRTPIYALMLFVLGLSLYLFIPIRYNSGAYYYWGEPGTLNGLIRIITRADYGGLKLHPEQSELSWTFFGILKQGYLYIRSLTAQFGYAVSVLGIAGIWSSRKERHFLFAIISFLFSGLFFVILSNLPTGEDTTLPILEPHFVMPNLIFAFFIASGLRFFLKKRVLEIAAFAVVIVLFVSKYTKCNYRNDYFAYDYGKNILRSLEKNSIVFNPDDPTAFILSYFQNVQGIRQDIRVVAYFRTRWGYERLKKYHSDIIPKKDILSGVQLVDEIIKYNINRRSIYAELPSKFPKKYSFSSPKGLMYRLYAESPPMPSMQDSNFYIFRNPGKKSSDYDFFTRQVISYYSSSYNNTGLSFADFKIYKLAKLNYMLALSVDNGLVASYNNLGTMYYEMGEYEQAEKYFSTVLAKDPRNPSSQYNMGLTYKSLGKTIDAVKMFSKSWELGYTNSGNEIGLIRLNEGRLKEALFVFNKILNENPGYAPAYYNAGLCCKNLGKYEDSRKYFSMYLNFVTGREEREEIKRLIGGI